MGMGMPDGMPPGMPPSGMMDPSAGMDPDMDGASMLGGASSANGGMDPDMDGDVDTSATPDQSFEQIMQMLNARALPPMPPMR